MSEEKPKPLFHIEHIFPADVKRQIEQAISNLREDQKSEFTFEGEPLYRLGRGHSFLHGFYTKYISKKGDSGQQFYGRWRINGVWYELIDGELSPIPLRPIIPWDISKPAALPLIKSIFDKIASKDLFSVQPMQKPKD